MNNFFQLLQSKTIKQFCKITFLLLLWLIFLGILQWFRFINTEEANQNVVLVVNVGIFLFSLLTSPATFEINAFGVRIGANKPGHIHFTEGKFEIRDFQNEWTKKEIKELLEETKSKVEEATNKEK